MKSLAAIAALVAVMVGVEPGGATAGVQKLYVLGCGLNVGKDQSRWSPGVNEGKSMEFSNNCYLIKHDKGLVLWDTGVPDAVAGMPDGMVVANGAITYRRAKTLASQLAQLGVKPDAITYVALSHTHGDHVGNIAMFPASTLLIQGSEYEWSLKAPVKPAYPVSQTVKKLAGDHDVFGDGSVTILSTPGHTPGHQSLLMRLPKTGAVLLSGDAVHFKDNWDNRRVPEQNTDKAQTVASLQRLADIMAKENAQLW